MGTFFQHYLDFSVFINDKGHLVFSVERVQFSIYIVYFNTCLYYVISKIKHSSTNKISKRDVLLGKGMVELFKIYYVMQF
jgi:hypothetical protein